VKKLLWLLPLSFVLYACPFESNVPLEGKPTEPVDSTLFGYWYGIVKDGSDYFGIEALDIKKHSDSVYSIIRYGKAAKGDIILPDTSYFTGYTSYIGTQRFMNIEGSVVVVKAKGRKKPPVVTTEKIYYLASIEKRNDTLFVKTISEDFSPTKKVFPSSEDLKNTILTLTAKQTNIFDDLYTQSYKRVVQQPKGF
jgi:hypothetical protein